MCVCVTANVSLQPNVIQVWFLVLITSFITFNQIHYRILFAQEDPTGSSCKRFPLSCRPAPPVCAILYLARTKTV